MLECGIRKHRLMAVCVWNDEISCLRTKVEENFILSLMWRRTCFYIAALLPSLTDLVICQYNIGFEFSI